MPARTQLMIRLRLLSGLVLFAFVVTHLLNHALGIVSLEWMERGRLVFLAFWRNLPMTTLLLAAVLVHAVLGWHKVFRLPSWRMPGWELAQISLGLLIPISLIPHTTGTAVANALFGVDDTYAFVLLALWSPWAISQLILVSIAWIHGCLGVHFWLRFRPGYRGWMPWLLGGAVALPLLSLAGFWNAGREAQALAADPVWLADRAAAGHWPGPEMYAQFTVLLVSLLVGTAVLTVALLAVRQLAAAWSRRRRSVRIRYTNGPDTAISPGTTVLQASREAGIAHASVCGGRGRCSTCRVRVDDGFEFLPPADPDERRVLARVGAPPNIRLACQIRPARDVRVTLLCPPHIEPHQAYSNTRDRYGRECELAILFSDLRGFTRLTEQKLGYDVVFLLNLYFRAMGEAIEQNHGHLVQVFGDGMMALFGMEAGPAAGCRQALRTARTMAERLEAINQDRPLELSEPLRMGVGVHSGQVVLGEMGHREATILTAVGESVNTTSRLQEATKLFGCQLVVSSRVGQNAGIDLSRFPFHEIEVRGTSRSLAVHALDSALSLPEIPAEIGPAQARGFMPLRSA